MFSLRTGESLDTKIDYFNKSLELLLSRNSEVAKFAVNGFEIEHGLHSTLFTFESDIPLCSLDLTLRWSSVLP